MNDDRRERVPFTAEALDEVHCAVRAQIRSYMDMLILLESPEARDVIARKVNVLTAIDEDIIAGLYRIEEPVTEPLLDTPVYPDERDDRPELAPTTKDTAAL